MTYKTRRRLETVLDYVLAVMIAVSLFLAVCYGLGVL